MKVKLIIGMDLFVLESKINEFISFFDGIFIVDIKYIQPSEYFDKYSAMVHYEEKSIEKDETQKEIDSILDVYLSKLKKEVSPIISKIVN